jgi:hypothetical protein
LGRSDNICSNTLSYEPTTLHLPIGTVIDADQTGGVLDDFSNEKAARRRLLNSQTAIRLQLSAVIAAFKGPLSRPRGRHGLRIVILSFLPEFLLGGFEVGQTALNHVPFRV